MEAGTVVTLVVDRETPHGYMLTNGEEEIFLHINEVVGEISIQDSLSVFLYVDNESRLTATMTIPKIGFDNYEWVEVVEVKKNLGVFIHIGIQKDILVSKDDLPLIEEIWPAKGDKLFCSLKSDKKGRLLGKLATEDIFQELAAEADVKDFNRNIKGRVYRLFKVGTFVITEENFLGFIHESERMKEPRLGQLVEGRIIDVKEDGSVNISLIPRSHEKLDDDSQVIIDYLEQRDGAMPYWDKSDPEDIMARFQMSKGAFKRAIGRLMKEGRVYQEDGWTFIKKD